MFIQFDRESIELRAICGILEDYKPTENIKLANEKAKALKEQLVKFMEETYKPAAAEIQSLIDEENKKFFKENDSTKE